MTASPALSPWPAPSPADAAPRTTDVRTPSAKETLRDIASLLLQTVKRYSSRSERAEHAAAKEEHRIGAELSDLPAGWFVQRSLDYAEPDGPSRRADHVVIGPSGVFIIYLDHQAGAKVWVTEHRLTINGIDNDDLDEVRYEAMRTSDQLSETCGFFVAVQSVLILIGASTIQILSRPAEVHVRNQYDIRDWLCKQPERLDAAMVSAVYAFGSSTTTGS
jgi:hypothetical protein